MRWRLNGPEDEDLDWDAIVGGLHEDNVRRLRGRIFKASKDGDLAKVRNLQKMMLRSWSNTLVSVRQVTQRNAGRETAGIDGQVALTSRARMDLAVLVHRTARSFQPLPVRRVFIPKANAKSAPARDSRDHRPVHQARCRNALEPEWEARFAPRYGFRPGRSCQDAIASSTRRCKGRTRHTGVVPGRGPGGGIRPDRPRPTRHARHFPGREMIRDWLKAGVFERARGSRRPRREPLKAV